MKKLPRHDRQGKKKKEKKRRTQKQAALLSPDMGEDFFQNSGTLGMQLRTGFFQLFADHLCLLRTKKTEHRLQI